MKKNPNRVDQVALDTVVCFQHSTGCPLQNPILLHLECLINCSLKQQHSENLYHYRQTTIE